MTLIIFIGNINAVIGKSVEDTKEIIRAGIDSTHYIDFYRKYADEDGESTAEDVTTDTTSTPERLFFQTVAGRSAVYRLRNT